MSNMKMRFRLTALLLAVMTLLTTAAPALATTLDLSTYQQMLDRSENSAAPLAAQQPASSSTTITTTSEKVERPTVQAVLPAAAETAQLPQQAAQLPIAGKLVLSTEAAATAYQWQVYVNGVWANVLGETESAIPLTYAMLSNAMAGDEAQVRCRMTVNGEAWLSAVACVQLDRNVNTTTQTSQQQLSVQAYAAQPANAGAVRRVGAARDAASTTTYLITVNYYYEGTETTVAQPHTAQVGVTSGTQDYKATLTLPVVTGYQVVAPVALPQDVSYQDGRLIFDIDQVTENITINVYYEPALVNYTVKYFKQNVSDDGYTEVTDDSVVKQGYTNSTIKDSYEEGVTTLSPEDKYPGFKPLIYDDGVKIAADGSTEINIYYDRLYFLMLFDLDGGTGVEPVFARYETPVTIAEPTRTGYVFAGWDKTIPSTVPNEDTNYRASWTVGQTTYSVVYWLENADDDGYSMAKFVGQQQGTTGSTISSADCVGFTEADEPDIAYLKRNKDKDTEYILEGDGSTQVNVYFDRKEYTIRFYYARSQQRTQTSYYITDYTNEFSNENGSLDRVNWPRSSSTLPALNDNSNWTQGTITQNGYTYYYFTLTAKYDADLTNSWPNAPFANRFNDQYTFVSWATQYGSTYNKTHTNKNIKGIYERMDKEIILDPTYDSENDRLAHEMLSYWAPNPYTYRYHIYYDVLEGETADTAYNGIDYAYQGYKEATSTATWNNQNALTFEGVEVVNHNGIMTYENESQDASPRNVNFYYKRKAYDLIFVSENETVGQYSVKYGTDLSTYKSYQPNPPAGMQFGGWYTTQDCLEGTEFEFTKQGDDGSEIKVTMPANSITLYAKWVPIVRTVKVYLTEKATMDGSEPLHTFDVSNGSPTSTADGYPKDGISVPENGSYEFTYWFYKDAEGAEKAFSFESTPITADTIVYAKWGANVFKQYIVYYVKEDGTAVADPSVWVADTTTGSALVGTTKTFEAKGDKELYLQYQEGWFPTEASHSFVIEIEGENTHTFVYKQADAVSYTVKYVDENGMKLHEPKEVENNRKAVVTENFVVIPGYSPDEYQKRLVVTIDGENVITFVYHVDTSKAAYVINHYQVSADGKTTLLYETKSDAVTAMPANVTVEPLTIANYLYDESRTKLIQNGTTSTPTGSPIAVAVKDYTDGFTLNLYYVEDEATIDYRIVYPDGTVNEAEAVCGALSSYTETLGVANGIVTGSVAAVSNTDYYDFEGWYTDETCTIALAKNWVTETETGTKLTPQKNGEIWTDTIYYAKFKEKQATIHYVAVGPDLKPLTDENIGKVEPISETVNILTGTANGSTATLTGMDAYKFVGWYTDEECTNQVSTAANYIPTQPRHVDEQENTVLDPWVDGTTYYAKFEYNITTLTIKKTGMNDGETAIFTVTATTEDQGEKTFTVAVPNGKSVTLNGLLIGSTYKVEEKGEWTWRYTSTCTNASGTLVADGNTVTFHNTKTTDKWLDDEARVHNNFSQDSSNQ